jgi:hypothetical protein
MAFDEKPFSDGPRRREAGWRKPLEQLAAEFANQ